MTRTLLTDGTILTMDPDHGVLEDADLLIEDGTIAAVGHDLDRSGAEVIDASDRLVLPGLVNSHAHLFQTGVRGVAGDWTLGDYFAKMLGTYREYYEPEDVYLGNLFGALEQLNAGVTSVLDWCHVINTPDHADRAVDALIDSGIRGVYCYGTPGINGDEWFGNSTLTHPEDAQRMHEERMPANDGRVTMGLAIRGPDQSTYEVTTHDIELARELGVPVSMHIGVAAYEGPSDHDVPKMADDGLLGPDVNFVHANHLSEDMYDILAEEGVSLSTTPEVEMQMGHGLPATGKMFEAGGRLVLGSDVVSDIGSDMFTPMRFALQTQRGLDNAEAIDRGEPLESLPMDCRDVLEAATIEGARALRLHEEVGSLTPGKRADVITIRTDDVNTAPVHDPFATVVLHAEPANVDNVFVDGELLKADGELTTSLFAERLDDLVASGERLVSAAESDD
ncbi:amidohydrolase family protein [Halomicroarcula sp. GCM10025324]|uniref:amidohydrolase family protein n=1 Tax=Haloarcula TaxID=2237 RepID=UPI0023E8BB97|nr:amidohydrolase family protein [Halomicroarcula sp. ZS-22-S1]